MLDYSQLQAKLRMLNKQQQYTAIATGDSNQQDVITDNGFPARQDLDYDPGICSNSTALRVVLRFWFVCYALVRVDFMNSDHDGTSDQSREDSSIVSYQGRYHSTAGVTEDTDEI